MSHAADKVLGLLGVPADTSIRNGIGSYTNLESALHPSALLLGLACLFSLPCSLKRHIPAHDTPLPGLLDLNMNLKTMQLIYSLCYYNREPSNPYSVLRTFYIITEPKYYVVLKKIVTQVY